MPDVLRTGDLIEREPLLAKMFPCAAKRQVEEAHAVNRWIPCSEKLPEINTEVLVTLYKPELSGYFRKIGRWLGDEWLINNLFGVSPERVVAWQPLPEAYEPPRED